MIKEQLLCKLMAEPLDQLDHLIGMDRFLDIKNRTDFVNMCIRRWVELGDFPGKREPKKVAFKTVCLNIEVDLHDKVIAIAKRTGFSKRDTIEQAMDSYLQEIGEYSVYFQKYLEPPTPEGSF